jgi:hypothetical protein
MVPHLIVLTSIASYSEKTYREVLHSRPLHRSNASNVSTCWSEPIFVVGIGHTGTSIMKTELTRHRSLLDVFPMQRCEMHLCNGESWLWAAGNNSKVVPSILNMWSSTCASQRMVAWVEKTPGHVLYIQDIQRQLPQARFVMMTRDLRDVFVSLLEKKNTDRDKKFNQLIKDVGRKAEASMNALQQAKGRVSGRVMHVRLEDFQAQCLKVPRSSAWTLSRAATVVQHQEARRA